MKDLIEAIETGNLNDLDTQLTRLGLTVVHLEPRTTGARLLINDKVELTVDDSGSWWTTDKSNGILRDECRCFDDGVEVLDFVRTL